MLFSFQQPFVGGGALRDATKNGCVGDFCRAIAGVCSIFCCGFLPQTWRKPFPLLRFLVSFGFVCQKFSATTAGLRWRIEA